MKATRKDASGNVPRNSMSRFLMGKDKIPAVQPAVNQNEQLATLVDNRTGQESDVGAHSEILEEATVVKSSDQTTQVPKNDNESNKGSNNDHTVTDEPDSCKKQASRNKQSEETERRRAVGNESARSRKIPRRSHHRDDEEEAETEAAAHLPKIEKVNFVMNSEGCFINGKSFDPRMPPKGIAIVVEQKSAESKTQSKKRK